MNSVLMVLHCRYHQREVVREALCPVCLGDVYYGEDALWVCQKHGLIVPRWESPDHICPWPQLHSDGVTLNPPTFPAQGEPEYYAGYG